MTPAKYEILNDGRRSKTGGPLIDEYYGPSWEIRPIGTDKNLAPTVIVPDPGDGSAELLAIAIRDFLNSSQSSAMC